MGRLLVRVFLGSCIVGVVGIVLAFVEAAWMVVQTALTHSLPQFTLSWARWDTALLLVLWWYFFLVLPVLTVLFFMEEASARRLRHASAATTPFDPMPTPPAPAVAILTAYNDEASIGLAVREFRGVSCIGEVIVVDNNSTDRTSEVASAEGATVIHEPRQGYGYACMGGLKYALEHTEAPRIVLAEGDMTFFAEDAGKLLPYLDDCDLVLGTRTTSVLTRKGSQMDWFMAWGNMFLAHLIRLRYWDPVFFGQSRVTDVGCTFRAIRRESLRVIMDRMTVGGHYFSPHMILVALQAHLRVVEVPIKFRQRVGPSKGAGGDRRRAMGIGLQMIREIALH